jgi:tetratricopeptide (TPR) repeat protein
MFSQKWIKTVLVLITGLVVLSVLATDKIPTVRLDEFDAVPRGMKADELAAEFSAFLNETGKFKVLPRKTLVVKQNSELEWTEGGNAFQKVERADYMSECFLVLDGHIMKLIVTLNHKDVNTAPKSAFLSTYCEDSSLRAKVATELLKGAAEMLASNQQTRFTRAVELYERSLALRNANKNESEKMRMQAADWAKELKLPQELMIIQINNNADIKEKQLEVIQKKTATEWINDGFTHFKSGQKKEAEGCFRCALELLNLKSFQELNRYEPVSSSPYASKDWKSERWGINFKWVSPGKLTVGSNTISIKKGFWISEKPVSRSLYQIFLEQDPDSRKIIWEKEYVMNYNDAPSPLNKNGTVKCEADKNKPMDYISYAGASIFITWFSRYEFDKSKRDKNMEYKLPSKDELLYAIKKLGLKPCHEGYCEWTRSQGDSGDNIVVSFLSCEYGEKDNLRQKADCSFRIVLTQP